MQSIAEAIGQLPVHVHSRDDAGGKERAPEHPAYKLLHGDANDWAPASTFHEAITRDALLYPNGRFAFINREGSESIRARRLRPIRARQTNGIPLELPRYVRAFVDRHGKARYYFRKPGTRRVTQPGIPYSPEFMEGYSAAMAEPRAAVEIGATRTKAGTINAAIVTDFDKTAF